MTKWDLFIFFCFFVAASLCGQILFHFFLMYGPDWFWLAG